MYFVFFAGASNANLGYKKLTENAFAPERGSPNAVGLDLRALHTDTVLKSNSLLVKTGIALKIPSNCYVRIAPRSGLALNNMIGVGAGVVDPDYTGEICVLLFNHSCEKDFVINRGDKIAQIICEMARFPELYEFEKTEITERGEGGFGSTN